MSSGYNQGHYAILSASMCFYFYMIKSLKESDFKKGPMKQIRTPQYNESLNQASYISAESTLTPSQAPVLTLNGLPLIPALASGTWTPEGAGLVLSTSFL